MTVADADAYWAEHHEKAKLGASFAPAAIDTSIAARIIRDLGLHRAVERSYRGRMYIIFKGNHRTRSLITGTRYSVTNPKIISLGIGKAGAKNMARKGGILSVVIVSAFNISELIMNDQYTLSNFVGDMATDIAVIATATGIGLAAGAMTGVLLAGAFVAGPIIAVIFVTAIAAHFLGKYAKHHRINERITEALDAAYDLKAAQVKALENSAKSKAADITLNVVELLIKAGSQELSNRFRRAIPRRRGNYNWVQF